MEAEVEAVEDPKQVRNFMELEVWVEPAITGRPGPSGCEAGKGPVLRNAQG